MENAHVLYTDHPGLVQRTPWWIVSSVFHLALVLLAGMWLMTEKEMKPPIDIKEFVIRPPVMPAPLVTRRPTTTPDQRLFPDEFYKLETVITKEDLKAQLESPNLMILDVRAGKDWKSSEFKIKGAARANPEEFDKWADTYPKDKKYFLYCA